MEDIKTYKNIVVKEPDNDFFLYPFICIVLRVVEETPFLTEKGMSALYYDLNEAYDNLMNGEKVNQKVLLKIVLYYTIAYNSSVLFIGMLEEVDNQPEIKERLGDEVEYLQSLVPRIKTNLEAIDKQIIQLLPNLSNKYARLYFEAKQLLFTKNLFENQTIHLPACPDEDFTPEEEVVYLTCKEVNT